MPPLKRKIKERLLQLPANLLRKTSRSPSPNPIALPETSTAGTPDVAPTPEDNQRSQVPLLSHPTSVEDTRLKPSHPSESSAHRPSELEHRPSAKIREGLGVAWIALKAALRLLEENADAFPPLKIAVSGLVAVLDFQEAFAENHEEYKTLVIELTSIMDILAPHVPALVERGVSSSVVRIVESISTELTHIKQQQDRNMTMRIIATNEDQGDILKRYRTIESLFRQLQSDITLRIWDDLRKQRDDSKKQRDDSRKQTEAALLEKMEPVYDALYNSSYSTTIKRGGCTPQTREEVLGQLESWAGDLEGAKIYWMNGMAGTGKTTISYTLCEWLEKNNCLGANYFCSRTSDLCRNADKILPTLAYQLAQYSHPFRSMLCNVLEKKSEICRLAVEVQFQNLIQTPLQAIKTAISGNVVVVIDALDECDGGDSFLTTLLELAEDLPIKFFIASRPEAEIYDQILASNYSDSILHLHHIEASIVGADIRTYLTKELGSISPTPSSDEVEQLVEASGKLFIYAATTVRYICSGKPGVDRRTRLETVLGMGNVSESTELQYRDLDKLYTTILAAAVNTEHYEPYEIKNTLLILRTVLCAEEPMTTQTLAQLLDLTKGKIQSSLQPLQSVLQTEDVEEVVAPFHASFPDFLFDKRRSKNFHFEKAVHNEILANHCFDLMKKELRFNICNLTSSLVFDEDVPDLPERIKRSISPALSYACRYWDKHFLQGSLSNTVHKQLVDFLTCRLLFWVEVLGLTQSIEDHVDIVVKIIARLKVSEHTHSIGFQTEIKAKGGANYSHTTKQLIDVRDFLIGLYWHQSTPHIYISNLTFCPRTSSVYKNYCRHTQRLAEEAIKFITAATITQGTEIASVSEDNIIKVWDADGNMVAGPFIGHKDRVQSIAFSPDGTRIVSGSDDHTIRVWDAKNGNMVAGPFNGYTGPVQSVAFSSDGTRIASGSRDHTIWVWDACNGNMVAGPFTGHTGSVQSVSFSLEDSRIASGSRDRTIRVWDAHNGNLVAGPFDGHTDAVQSVAFSPNGTRIASGSDDHTIRLWDAHNGNIVAGPFHGHTGPVQSVAFSPDGTRIASGSRDHTIRAWDAHSGNMVAGPFNGHIDSVWSVAFSPDGTRIASGSDDHTIRVWDAHNGNMVTGPFNGYTRSVHSVAFSPDGTRIASGSWDCTIRVWDAHNGNMVTGPFNGHTDPVQSVAFSPDGTRIVSGSEDETIRVWDAHNGNMVAGPFNGHTDPVQSVAFSPHGTRIVSGSDDHTIRVWDADSGNMVAGPFHGHIDSVHSVAFSPDSTRIVSGSFDQTIRVWDAHNGNMVAGPFDGHTSSVQSVAFSSDGTRIASGSHDCTIRVWDAHNGNMVAGPFNGHKDRVQSVAFSPDGTRIVSGSDDHTIRVWDAHNGNMVAGPFHGHMAWVLSVAFSPDGAQIVSSSSDDTIRVWDANNGIAVAISFNGHTDSILSVVFSPDGTQIASGSANSTIEVWNAYTGACAHSENTDMVKSVAFSPDGTRIVSGSHAGAIRVWDAKNGNMVAGPFNGHTDIVWSVAFSPDGTRIISGSEDCTIRVWDVHNGNMVAGPFIGHTDPVQSVAFSPDGTRIVSGSGDETIRVWDAYSGNMVAGPFNRHKHRVQSVPFSSDGARIVSDSEDENIGVWDAHNGNMIAGSFHGDVAWLQSIAFSPDGTRIASGSWDYCTIQVWDAHNGNIVAGPFNGHTGPVQSAAFSPDGAQIASGSWDCTIRVWDAHNGNMVAGPFNGHTGPIQSVAFSPNGTRIVSGSQDCTIRVWDAHNGNMVAGPFHGHITWVQSVAFSPDGTQILSGSNDSTIRVWDAHIGLLNPDCAVLSLISRKQPGDLHVKQFTLKKYKWIAADNQLLFHLPDHILPMLPYVGNILVITPRGSFSPTPVAIDLPKLFIEERWSQGYCR